MDAELTHGREEVHAFHHFLGPFTKGECDIQKKGGSNMLRFDSVAV
jgi:hypothetical protein